MKKTLQSQFIYGLQLLYPDMKDRLVIKCKKDKFGAFVQLLEKEDKNLKQIAIFYANSKKEVINNAFYWLRTELSLLHNSTKKKLSETIKELSAIENLVEEVYEITLSI